MSIQTLFRAVLAFVGCVSLALGVIGIFVPLLPTTPFLLLSALCFSKSSTRLHNWLLQHKYFGPAIVEWQTNRVIRPRVKLLALSTIAIGIATVWYKIPDERIYYKVAITAIMLSVSTFIATRRSRPLPRVHAEPVPPGPTHC